ncbi:hypothetical protein LEN26_003653, partial [Aphanomyces euteiches]
DRSWLGSKSSEIKALKEIGQIGDLIKELMQEEELDAADSISACFIGENKPPIGHSQIHVLVVAPGYSQPNKKQRTTVYQWRDEEPIVYLLKTGTMYFVNRKDAVEQLQTIFEIKYARAVRGHGPEWVIPLVDNVLGLGKSAFGYHFIQKSRETWPEASKRTPFQKTLCNCHTVFITFTIGELLQNSLDVVMMEYLIRKLTRMFQIQPDILSKPPKSTLFFLDDLTNVVGPLFIVLDEIGAAFFDDELTDFEQRERFLSFCNDVVGKWLTLPKVFFLLVGRGSFLSYVGRRPQDVAIQRSFFNFERLKLNLLRTNAIQEILEKTMISNEEPISIATKLELNDSAALNERAKLLFKKTNGLPRSLLCALEESISGNLLDDEEPFPIQDSNLEKFYDELVRNKKEVLYLLAAANERSPVDMLGTIKDNGSRKVSLDIIANNSCVAWEGTAESAHVFVHPKVKSYMEGLLMPFTEYIRYIGDISGVSVDYPSVFEWMTIKRFQQAFTKKSQPQLVMPDFFTTPIFGNCKDLAFSLSTRPMPKITSKGNRHPNLNSATASPDSWNTLLEEIISLGDVCLKPLPKSASSDGFLVTNAKFEDKEVKVICGLAVKNYTTTPFADNNLSKECDVFNRMFNEIGSTGYLRILFVCCTRYSEAISDKFNGKSYFVHHCKESFPNIDETILLNLETPQQRAAFFAVDGDLPAFVERVVGKAEV